MHLHSGSLLSCAAGRVKQLQPHPCRHVHRVAPTTSRHRRQHAAAAAAAAAAPNPPDVAPDVLLLLRSDPQIQSTHSITDSQQQQQEEAIQIQHQQDAAVLVPRTHSRLQGLGQLPGFIPSLAPQPDPQLVVWQQESLEAWQAASSWVQQQQQQQQDHQQQDQQQQDQEQQDQQQQQQRQVAPADNLQQLLGRPFTHWAPLAAVLQAGGRRLQLQHLLCLTEALAALLDSSSSSAGAGNGFAAAAAAAASDLFVPDVMALNVASQHIQQQQQQQQQRRQQQRPDRWSGSSSGGSQSQLLLECKAVLPQLCRLLLAHLQQPEPWQQQQQQQQQEAQPSPAVAAATAQPNSSSSSSSTGVSDASVLLASSAAVSLLQQLSVLHSSGAVGPIDPQLTAVLVEQHVTLQDCSLQELAVLLLSCARLGHPHRSTWLQEYISTAQHKLADDAAAAAQHMDTAAAAADGLLPPAALSSSSSNTPSEVVGTAADAAAAAAAAAAAEAELQAFAAAVSQLLEAVARYPGPHADTPALKPFLSAVQPLLPTMCPSTLQSLGTAVAALQLKPGAAWRHALAAAARGMFGGCSLQQLVALLLGVTAGGFNPQEHWWRGWTAATMRKFEGLFGAHTGPDWAPAGAGDTAAAGGGAAGGDSGDGSAGTDSWEGTEEADNHNNNSSSSGQAEGSRSSSSTLTALQQQQQQQQEEGRQSWHEGDGLPGGLCTSVCLVLLQLGRQVHPLWLAGLLEAYLRSITPADLASTPQLLLLASRLLASPPGFAGRYKPLLLRLLGPLQHNFNLLNPEQMAEAAEVCAVYRLNITGEWYRWHGAAVLRLGKTFPLAALARVREAYRSQEVPAEQQLQVLLSTVPWRLQRQAEAQEREDRRAAKKEVIGFKMDQRRRQNIADAEKKAAAAAAARGGRGGGAGNSSSSSAGGEESIGMGYKGPGGRENWRKRKLKPPGTLGRKF